MYPYHVFNLEPAGTFGMYPICYRWVSGGYIQPEPAMYSRCFRWFLGPLAPSVTHELCDDLILFHHLLLQFCHLRPGRAELLLQGLDPTKLLDLHDHCIVRMVHCIVRLERRSNQLMPTMDLQFDRLLIGHLPSNDKDRSQQYQSTDDKC